MYHRKRMERIRQGLEPEVSAEDDENAYLEE